MTPRAPSPSAAGPRYVRTSIPWSARGVRGARRSAPLLIFTIPEQHVRGHGARAELAQERDDLPPVVARVVGHVLQQLPQRRFEGGPGQRAERDRRGRVLFAQGAE